MCSLPQGYSVGERLSIADCLLFDTIEMHQRKFGEERFAEAYPDLAALAKKIRPVQTCVYALVVWFFVVLFSRRGARLVPGRPELATRASGCKRCRAGDPCPWPL